MTRLYLRVYVALVASIAVFALAAGFLWRQVFEAPGARQGLEVAAALAQQALPPADAAPAAQQSGLARLAGILGTELTLYAPDRARIAVVGEPLPAPSADRHRAGWLRRADGPPALALPLADGRWLVVRTARWRRHPAFGLFSTLALLVLAVGVGAYPVVRRLTSRIERLQSGVEQLGAGDLRARVKVEGRDEVARLAASFNRAAERIEQLVGAHKSLLAATSHELRTPLARIRLAIELMKEGGDARRKGELERDIAELDGLIDEILLLSRLDAAPSHEADEEVDLLALAAEECARYEEAELDGQPVSLRGDARLLRRLIRNLLENARRHGAPPIEVRICRTARDRPEAAELRVRDHGPGIAADERERVFEPFYRHPNAGQGAGAGLGLALVRQIARRHGGEARVEDADPGGSCFVVRLAGARRSQG
ncbi:MAG: HAMP domain-containing histidine kinase [Betaproteobacteria bacterium]|nr:HAMP domain-containing histidine kinase [Betaproteobacteria bacterium]